jgi:molecular chaperone HscB
MNIDDDDFTLFGLPEHFELDAGLLDNRRRELQAATHPDRFAGQGAAAQRIAMQWSMRVNQAYQRLKDPLQRAAYLCQRRGVAIDAERNTAMPRDFLLQQMAWREALDDAHDDAAVRALDAQVAAQEQELMDQLHRLLDVQPDTATAATLVRALMFVARFRQDVEQRLEALES